jgi:hypothetical protein
MPIPPRLPERIATFPAHRESCQATDCKEFRFRAEFLHPLFAEQGWGITNKAGYAEADKGIVHEHTLKFSGVGTVAPDLSLRIGGTRKFFVEPKKPSVSIKDDRRPPTATRRRNPPPRTTIGTPRRGRRSRRNWDEGDAKPLRRPTHAVRLHPARRARAAISAPGRAGGPARPLGVALARSGRNADCRARIGLLT